MDMYRIQTNRYNTFCVVAFHIAAAVELTRALLAPGEEMLRVEFSCTFSVIQDGGDAL